MLPLNNNRQLQLSVISFRNNAHRSSIYSGKVISFQTLVVEFPCRCVRRKFSGATMSRENDKSGLAGQAGPKLTSSRVK